MLRAALTGVFLAVLILAVTFTIGSTFKSDLKPAEIWKVVTFMRAAFAESKVPAGKDAAPPP